MKRSTLALLLLVCLALGLALPACGGSAVDETPTAIGATGSDTPAAGDTGSDTSDKPTPAPTPTLTGAQVGTAVQVGDYTITVTSAKIDNDSLTVAITFDNSKGSGTVNIPDQSFSAVDADGKTSLDSDLLCTTLATRADAGKTVQGNVCWKANGATSATGMTVTYDAGKTAKITWKLP
jgi:hypothetical protein